jgi:hypothetical protein
VGAGTWIGINADCQDLTAYGTCECEAYPPRWTPKCIDAAEEAASLWLFALDLCGP